MRRILPPFFQALALVAVILIWQAWPESPPAIDAVSSHQAAKALKKERRPDAGPNALPNEWMFRMLAWPEGEISLEAVRRARQQAERMPAAHGASRAIWQQAGPLNIGGRVTDIALDPADSNRVFVASAAGGVFRTTDGGASWQEIFQNAGALAIGDIALDPLDPQVLWVGTGESNSSSYGFPGNGVWKSDDGGDSWQAMGLDSSGYIGRIVIDPTDSQRLWVAALGRLYSTGGQRGVYYSPDGGQTWEQQLFINDTTSVVDLAIDPGNPDRLFACSWQRLRTLTSRVSGGEGSGVWRSLDGGQSWSELTGILPQGALVGRPAVALAAGDPQRVYLSYADHPGYFLGLYRSDNGGESFVRVNDGILANLYSSFGWYFGNLRVDPQDDDHVHALGVTWWRSLDAGDNWNRLAHAVHVDYHALERHPQSGRWWIGNDGGLYASHDLVSYTHFQNIPLTQFYNVAFDPSDPQRIFGGTQDNGTIGTQTGGLADWENLLGGDGFHVIVHPEEPQVLYAEYQWGNLRRSDDGGQSWFQITNGISGGDRRNWNTPLALSPLDPEVLYTGTQRVWRSDNRGASWSAISGDLSQGFSGDAGFNTLTCLAPSPVDSLVLWAGCDDGNLARTTSGGAFWQQVGGSLPQRWITGIAPDPALAGGAVVSLGGLRWEDPEPHVYRTWDYGASWAPIHGNLPDAPVYDIVIDPQDGQRIWAATETGCYVTRDGGMEWTLAAGGLPLGPVLDLAFHAPSRQLLAGTHGRSAWRLFVDEHPEQVPQLQASLEGPLLRLSWTVVSGAGAYRVYASPTPWFVPGESELLATVSDTTFSEVFGVDPRFYRVDPLLP